MPRKAQKSNPDERKGTFTEVVYDTGQGEVVIDLNGLTEQQRHDKIAEALLEWHTVCDENEAREACQPEASSCAPTPVSSLYASTAIGLVQAQSTANNGLAMTVPRISNKNS